MQFLLAAKSFEIKDFCITMWKFKKFSTTQILREISFGDSRSAKYAILTHLESLKFDFHEFLHSLKAEIHQIIRFRAHLCISESIKINQRPI